MKKIIKIFAPVEGTTKDITEVSDPVFAQKLVGDGVAINPTGNTICAPCDGILNHVFGTNHAFTIITPNKVEILVHLGIDTIDLKGLGFKRLISAVDIPVKAGEPLIHMDLDIIKENEKETDVMVIISDIEGNYKIKKKLKKQVTSVDEIFKITIK